VRSVQSGYGVRWRIEVAEVYGRGKSMWMSTAAGFLAKCCCRWLYSMLLHWVSSMCDVLSWKLGISMNGGMWDAVTRGLRVHVESKLDTMLACFDDSVLISRICVGFGRTQGRSRPWSTRTRCRSVWSQHGARPKRPESFGHRLKEMKKENAAYGSLEHKYVHVRYAVCMYFFLCFWWWCTTVWVWRQVTRARRLRM
jgi:hypothetical protein